MQTKNRLKIALYEYKFTSNISVSEYNNVCFSITFNSKTISTDKINIYNNSKNNKFQIGKIFYFDIPEKIDDKLTIIINLISTSWMVFNTVICSCEVNYKQNLNDFNNVKRWISLKNKENNEIIKILISICDLNNKKEKNENKKLLDIPLFNTKESFVKNTTKSNASFIDNNKVLNNTIITKTQRYKNTNSNNSSKDLFVHLNNNTNNSSIIIENILNKRNCKKKNTYTNINDKTYSLEENYMTFINNNQNSENVDLNKILFLIEKYENEGGDKNIIKKFKEDITALKEKESNLEKEKKIFDENKKQLKENNKILNKERQSLENKIINFNKEQNEFEEKNSNLIQNMKDFEEEKNNFIIKQKIDLNNKNIFYNLNYFISTGNNIPLSNNENKIFINEKDKNELIDSLNFS